MYSLEMLRRTIHLTYSLFFSQQTFSNTSFSYFRSRQRGCRAKTLTLVHLHQSGAVTLRPAAPVKPSTEPHRATLATLWSTRFPRGRRK